MINMTLNSTALASSIFHIVCRKEIRFTVMNFSRRDLSKKYHILIGGGQGHPPGRNGGTGPKISRTCGDFMLTLYKSHPYFTVNVYT